MDAIAQALMPYVPALLIGGVMLVTALALMLLARERRRDRR